MHKGVFANLQIAGAGPAAPFTRFAVGDGVLEPIELRKVLLLEILHRQEYGAFPVADWPQLAFMVMNDADRGRKSKLQRAAANRTGL